MQFIANNRWKCQLNSVSRIFEATDSEGTNISCHFSQPEIRLFERLLASANSPVARKDLTEFAWGGRPVASGSLNHAIFNLRNAFGQGEGHQVIQTVPNRGYKICAVPLDTASELAPEPAAEPFEEADRDEERRVPGPPGWMTKFRGKTLALLLALNAGLTVATYLVIERKSETTFPTLAYAPLSNADGTQYFASRSLPNDDRLASAVDALAAHPSSLSPSRPFVYINSATRNGQYGYFLCDKSLTANSPNCAAYVIESMEARQ